MLTINHLKLVGNIVDSGTLTKAADKMHLSQSALSHQLKDLEQKLGARIFLRNRKKLYLTAVGKKIYEKSKQIICDLENLEKDVVQFINGEDILIKVSTACYTTYQWLPAALKNIRSTDREVDIRIEEKATRNVIDYVSKGEIDIGIVSSQHQNFRHLEYLKLFDDQLMLVVNSSNSLAKRKTVGLRDFKNLEVFLYDVKDEESLILDRFKTNGIVPKKTTKIPLTEAIIEMVNADLGVTIMANWIVKPYLRNKQIQVIPINDSSFARTWYFAYLTERSAELSNILEIIKQEILQSHRSV